MGHADLHVHTSLSDGVGSVDQVLAAAQRSGLDVIAITDHNEIEAAFQASRQAQDYNLEVIVGEEISSTAGHILGLFLSEKVPAGLTPEEVVAEIHRQGGLAVIPHPTVPKPFPKYQGIGESWVFRLDANPKKKFWPDGIEVRNGFTARIPGTTRLIKSRNESVWRLAEIGGSDSHHPRSIGSAWTQFNGTTAEDLWRSIANFRTIARGEGWPWYEVVRALSKDIFYFKIKKKLFGPEPWQYTRPK